MESDEKNVMRRPGGIAPNLGLTPEELSEMHEVPSEYVGDAPDWAIEQHLESLSMSELLEYAAPYVWEKKDLNARLKAIKEQEEPVHAMIERRMIETVSENNRAGNVLASRKPTVVRELLDITAAMDWIRENYGDATLEEYLTPRTLDVAKAIKAFGDTLPGQRTRTTYSFRLLGSAS